jgi:hypothetical protein
MRDDDDPDSWSLSVFLSHLCIFIVASLQWQCLFEADGGGNVVGTCVQFTLPTGYPYGYGYPPDMGMGKFLYPWVRVWAEVYTHWLYQYGYGISLPCPLPSLPL